MKTQRETLIIRHWDKKTELLKPLVLMQQPEGWIHTLRTTLNMSLRQLGERLNITPQSVRDIEQREKEGTVTINTLKAAAGAMDMQFVYGLVPKDESLEKMVERRAYEMASKIVHRASTTMRLENQENSPERIEEAIRELAYDIKREMPKKLWD